MLNRARMLLESWPVDIFHDWLDALLISTRHQISPFLSQSQLLLIVFELTDVFF
jgi:hypothetical protein